MGLMVMTPKRRLRRSVFASLFKLIVCTSNVTNKLVLPPTLVPDKAWCRALQTDLLVLQSSPCSARSIPSQTNRIVPCKG